MNPDNISSFKKLHGNQLFMFIWSFSSRSLIKSEYASALIPPIRQTASIFKQPVTVYKTQESRMKADLKHGHQEKPKQVL